MRFTIVDIETTGGSLVYHRVVEIALVVVENGIVVEEFQSLVQPEMHIPLNVQLIHGISDQMVENAPLFSDLIPEIDRLMGGSIFVAHSAAFDFGFLKAEYQRLGLPFVHKKLCTVKLGRKLEPGLSSYSLANLCKVFKINNLQAHRALSDAKATAEIFIRYFHNPAFEAVKKQFLGRGNHESIFPPHLKPERFVHLPQTTGVYLFHDFKGKVLYVGKAKQIKDRVLQHFSGHTHTKAKSSFTEQIYDVSFEEAGHEMMALLLENELVKKHFPRYNTTLKEFKISGGVFQYQDQDGFFRLVAGEAGKWTNPAKLFKSKAEAHMALLKFSMENALCLKLNHFFGKESKACQYETSEGKKCLVCVENWDAENYNAHLIDVLSSWEDAKTLLLMTPGRNEQEKGMVYVERGKIRAYGFLQEDENWTNLHEIINRLKPYYHTQDAIAIIKPYLEKASPKIELPEGIWILAV
jgi:DNA polymerase-3 subunit epsilon